MICKHVPPQLPWSGQEEAGPFTTTILIVVSGKVGKGHGLRENTTNGISNMLKCWHDVQMARADNSQCGGTS